MRRFFSSMTSLDHYTFSLDTAPRDDVCQHCLKSNQWVSHGYVYKQRSINTREVVGKRILCANRYGKSGCGRTRQLYLKTEIPQRQYNAHVITTFVLFLLQDAGVVQSYLDATGTRSEGRHAWRWVQDLFRRIGWFRGCLGKPADEHYHVKSPSKRLNILLPTLAQLFHSARDVLILQKRYQSPFF